MTERTKHKKKPAFRFNIGIIAFILIFVYIVGHMIIYFNQDELAIYEVIQSRIHDSVQTKGLILREETIVKSEKSGYLNYYVSEQEQVKKNGLIYTCDETGEVHDYISNLLKQEQNLTADDYADIKEALIEFTDNYSDSQFQDVYDLKYDLENQTMQLGDTVMAEHMDEIEANMGSDSFIKYYSGESGLVTYLEDGFEGKTLDDLSAEDFDITKYSKKELKSTGKIKKNQSVYRITKGPEWQIVVPLTKKEYKKLKEKSSVTVVLTEDDLTVSCPITYKKIDGEYYGVLSMTNYLGRYSKDRFIDVEIEIEEENGLKIPNTAISEEEFYKVPKMFFMDDSVSQNTVIVKETDSKGQVSFVRTTVTIAKSEDGEEGTSDQGYFYISVNDIPENTLLGIEDSGTTFLLNHPVKLQGVYNVNRGYADFRCIDIIMENNDYSIVRMNVTNSISLYDRIVLNGNTISDNEIIY
ncbi:MAG: HlyD family efflux transporter periplasmic adaptor subunit [Lachnospiraceae bacterium]|nr:HlyD family efflux transporter periplasmic adaptor subunit [Lachnospiraceae bacterium]